MTVPTVLSSNPQRTRFQRFLRKLIGARDLVVVHVVYVKDGKTLTTTRWLDGVDMDHPISTESSGVLVELSLPTTPDGESES